MSSIISLVGPRYNRPMGSCARSPSGCFNVFIPRYAAFAKELETFPPPRHHIPMAYDGIGWHIVPVKSCKPENLFNFTTWEFLRFIGFSLCFYTLVFSFRKWACMPIFKNQLTSVIFSRHLFLSSQKQSALRRATPNKDVAQWGRFGKRFGSACSGMRRFYQSALGFS